MVRFIILSFYYRVLLENPLAGLAVILALLLVYFLPSIIALFRGHRNKVAVFILNLLLGFTVIGWVLALVWAVYKRKTKDEKRLDEFWHWYDHNLKKEAEEMCKLKQGF